MPVLCMTDSLPTQASGQGTILVVDDDLIVRDLTKAILVRAGYRVLVAEGGQEALQIYQEQQDEIDLIILDMTMPKMSGPQCYRVLCELNPAVKVIVSSGHSSKENVQDLFGDRVVGFVQKPYRVDDLMECLRKAFIQR